MNLSNTVSVTRIFRNEIILARTRYKNIRFVGRRHRQTAATYRPSTGFVFERAIRCIPDSSDHTPQSYANLPHNSSVRTFVKDDQSNNIRTIDLRQKRNHVPHQLLPQ